MTPRKIIIDSNFLDPKLKYLSDFFLTKKRRSLIFCLVNFIADPQSGEGKRKAIELECDEEGVEAFMQEIRRLKIEILWAKKFLH